MAQSSTRPGHTRFTHEPERGARALVDEVARYLAGVDLFRALGYEPTWRPEVAPGADERRSFDRQPLDAQRPPSYE